MQIAVIAVQRCQLGYRHRRVCHCVSNALHSANCTCDTPCLGRTVLCGNDCSAQTLNGLICTFAACDGHVSVFTAATFLIFLHSVSTFNQDSYNQMKQVLTHLGIRLVQLFKSIQWYSHAIVLCISFTYIDQTCAEVVFWFTDLVFCRFDRLCPT